MNALNTSSGTPFDIGGFLKSLTGRPGIYRMLGASGEVLYVGKALNLKKRVASYFNSAGGNSLKTQSLVDQIHGIEVTVTHTENEALILENNLIKQLKPRYNILLRDSKGYPYIFLSSEQTFPRLEIHRGVKREKGRYFGPYPSVGAARESLNLLQRVFRIRPCEDSFFNNRSRPCLQHQINRCSGPCVGMVDTEAYQQDIRHVIMFLEGKNHEIIDELVRRMEASSVALNFERAAAYRDQIANLRRVQERQYVDSEHGDTDVIAAVTRNGVGCVQVFYIRAGRNLGNKTFFPRLPGDASAEDILSAFIPQYYLSLSAETTATTESKVIPSEILISHGLEDVNLLEQELGRQAAHKVTISHNVRGQRAHWLQMAAVNAEHSLAQQLASKGTTRQRMQALQELLELDHLPVRLECFDISHTMGEAAVAACVVFDANGPLKSDYRRFNIAGITPGDDYAALRQALLRRYTRLKRGEGKLPDILFIDGGRGQVAQAESVLEELQINDVMLLGIAKGAGRKPGLESLIPASSHSIGLSAAGAPLILPSDSPALHLIQQIRDEAHRFAITGHRQRRSKARNTSTLESIPGMGSRRRQQLLKQFGGLQEVARAGVEDLAKVHGISRQIAQKIYDTFHNE
ncbi:MAG: excinuclease ABC subunit UvrC [Gammaproteobacteria bacterium]